MNSIWNSRVFMVSGSGNVWMRVERFFGFDVDIIFGYVARRVVIFFGSVSFVNTDDPIICKALVNERVTIEEKNE